MQQEWVFSPLLKIYLAKRLAGETTEVIVNELRKSLARMIKPFFSCAPKCATYAPFFR